jgi:hypothetical protein
MRSGPLIELHQSEMIGSNIKQATTAFQQIATACNGQYDGWEANVMDNQIVPSPTEASIVLPV